MKMNSLLKKIRTVGLSLIILLFCLPIMAELVLPQQALVATQRYLAQKPEASLVDSHNAQVFTYQDGKLFSLDKKAEIDENTTLYFIMFTDSNYAIVAADDNVFPVLAYSNERLTKQNDLPPAVYWWLDNYSTQIRETRNAKLLNTTNQTLWASLLDGSYSYEPNRDRSVVPLVTTLWNQDWPYNALCPVDPAGPGGRVYAGCVATAMGMVMKYWNHPTTGVGNHSYYASGYGYQSANFGATTYLWDQMLDSIGSEYIPIATLLYHLGVSVNMGYAPDGSGAQSTTAATSMANYFRYPTAQFKSKSDYTDSAWSNLMTAQIDEGSPVYYSGYSNDGGHAFVLDGYDATNHFHFNFGWSGSGNGYYYTSNINGFSSYQGAIINTIPANYSIANVPVKLSAPSVAVGDNFNLTVKTNPVLGSWGINHYDLELYYDYYSVNYVGWTVDGTISQSGDIAVNTDTPGVIGVNWNSANILAGGGDLIKFTFMATEAGEHLFDLLSMNYNTTPVTNTTFVMVDAVAPVASLPESSISLSNIMHLAYNTIGTTSMSTTYLLPSWNVTHYQCNISYNPEKLQFVGVETLETLSAGLDVQATVAEPGVLSISCDSPIRLTGDGVLLKLQFRAIGNGSSLSVTQLGINSFQYNTTPINAVGTANVILSAYTANEDEVINTPKPQLEIYPNPFAEMAVMKLNNSSKEALKVEVFNLKGQIVNTFKISDPANDEFHWQSKDYKGNSIGSGIYLLKWQQGEYSGSHKLLIVK